MAECELAHNGVTPSAVGYTSVALGTVIADSKKVWLSPNLFAYLFIIYSSIAAAAVLPAPIARITVAAPVTASPPA